MTKVINRGLIFSVQPPSIDVTQVLVDYKKFERVMIWKEYWHSKDSEESSDKKRNIFKSTKTNLPKKYRSPESLKAFLNSVKSELMDPLNRNKIPNNITENESKALKDLSKLQSERKIVIKPMIKVQEF